MQTSLQVSTNRSWSYQSFLNKFWILRPHTSKQATETVFQLLIIFLLFCIPAVLPSDSCSQFTAEVMEELRELWPQLILVQRKPSHSPSWDSIKRASGHVKDMLVAWKTGKRPKDRSFGVRFVPNMTRSVYHSVNIQCTPYAAMFGTKFKVGLTPSSQPSVITEKLQTKDDLFSTPLQKLKENQ